MLDNAPAHASERVLPLLQEHFQVLFFPPYTPMFNSIETLWGLFKPRFKFMLSENEAVANRGDLA